MTCLAHAWSGLRAAAVGGVACCAIVATRADVQPFSGQYEGSKKFGLATVPVPVTVTATAKAKIELRRSARFIHYTMHSTVTVGRYVRRFRDCSVIGVDGEHTLQPLEYTHVDESKPKFNVRTRFDWTQNKAITLIGASTDAVTAELTGTTWDPMSFQVALLSLAPLRAAGARETHHVIERGALKRHQVSFSGAAPLLIRGQSVLAHEVISRKSKGQVVLYLSTPSSLQPRRPLRITIDDVTIDLAAGGDAASPPASLADGPTPSCDAGTAR